VQYSAESREEGVVANRRRCLGSVRGSGIGARKWSRSGIGARKRWALGLRQPTLPAGREQPGDRQQAGEELTNVQRQVPALNRPNCGARALGIGIGIGIGTPSAGLNRQQPVLPAAVSSLISGSKPEENLLACATVGRELEPPESWRSGAASAPLNRRLQHRQRRYLLSSGNLKVVSETE